MAAPKDVAEPHKELRFTRAGQAQGFIVAAAVAVALALLLAVTALTGHPNFHWWMPLIPLVLAGFLTRLAARCARHAYLILTPLGVEIFPLFKADKNLNLVYWTQIEGLDFDDELETLKIHFNAEQTGGVILSLKPILAKKRPLLQKALEGRMAEKS